MNRRTLLLAAPALILSRKANAVWTKLSTFSPTVASIATGWTTFTPSADTLISYVSDSIGNDGTAVQGTLANGWDCTHPYKTISAGKAALRTGGHPDWLLLKQGDTFTDQWFGSLSGPYNGSSATIAGDGSISGMMVFGSYDPAHPGVVDPFVPGNARPLIKTNSTITGGSDSQFIIANGTGGTFFALVGVEAYAYTRNPADPGYNAGTVTNSGLGIFWNGVSYNYAIVENCKTSFYVGNVWQNGPGLTTDILKWTRNVIIDAYSSDGHAVGIYLQCSPNPTFTENVWDNNGNNSLVPAQGRNIYLGASAASDPQGQYQSTLIREMSSNSSSEAAQMRLGGSMTDCLGLKNDLGWHGGSHQTGGSPEAPPLTNWQVTRCVSSEFSSFAPYAFYAQGSTNTATISFNKVLVNQSAQILYGIQLGENVGNSLVSNVNLTWYVCYDTPEEAGAYGTDVSNTCCLNDLNAGSSTYSHVNLDPHTALNTQDSGTQPPHWRPDEPFPDPTNGTIAAYMTSIGYLPATADEYIRRCRLQSKNNWDPLLVPDKPIAFMLGKFGVPLP